MLEFSNIVQPHRDDHRGVGDEKPPFQPEDDFLRRPPPQEGTTVARKGVHNRDFEDASRSQNAGALERETGPLAGLQEHGDGAGRNQIHGGGRVRECRYVGPGFGVYTMGPRPIEG
jgi:hypothetical protein